MAVDNSAEQGGGACEDGPAEAGSRAGFHPCPAARAQGSNLATGEGARAAPTHQLPAACGPGEGTHVRVSLK